MKKINILVTGAGSGVGQSIIKALKISKLNLNIISADINVLNAALYRTKKSLIIPKVEKKNSLGLIIKILKKNKINILFVGSEIEIDFFSVHKNYIFNKTGTYISVTKPSVVKIANDKFQTIEFFKKNNIRYPKSFIINSKKDLNILYLKMKKPFILKSRFGTSARSVYLIRDKKDFANKTSLVEKPMIQEYLGKKNSFFDEEFTCSIFTDKNKNPEADIFYTKKHFQTIDSKKTIHNYKSISCKYKGLFNEFSDLIVGFDMYNSTDTMIASICQLDNEIFHTKKIDDTHILDTVKKFLSFKDFKDSIKS